MALITCRDANKITKMGNLVPKILLLWSCFIVKLIASYLGTLINRMIFLCRGYMALEYALWGYLTYKADAYSFGIVALEVVAGKNNMKFRPNEDFVSLLDWVR
jgi:hypothetical protein